MDGVSPVPGPRVLALQAAGCDVDNFRVKTSDPSRTELQGRPGIVADGSVAARKRPMSVQVARRVLGAVVQGELRGPRFCTACGHYFCHRKRRAISNTLATDWELSAAERRDFDEREGYACLRCTSSLRTQALASSVTAWANDQFGLGARSLAEVVRSPDFQRISVAEVNPCGGLHPILAAKPNLDFSDYGDPERSQDFQALTYSDQSFDLMLSSDTLEHIPDLDATLHEIRRVLKPTGTHLFTVPVTWDRPSRTRMTVDPSGRRHRALRDSFHGRPPTPDRVVFREFGYDAREQLSIPGLSCAVSPPSSEDSLVVFSHIPYSLPKHEPVDGGRH